MKLKGKHIKYLLYVYTFFLIVAAIFSAFSLVRNSDRTAEAMVGNVNCDPVYNGNSFQLVGPECGNLNIVRCSASYSQELANSCFISTNCYVVGTGQEGNTYSPDPAPGECVQVDFSVPGSPADGGGVCGCQPPAQPTTVQCNDTCNTTDRLCPHGLACTNVDGVNRCRLPENPGSAACHPVIIETVSCNEECNNTNLLCPGNLACTNVNGTNRCRLPENPGSLTCEIPIPHNPAYIIDKEVDGQQGDYGLGELVTYKIKITNTGNTAFTNLKFRDVYNPNYLTYVGGSATKSSGGSISDINPYLTVNATGTIEIENITAASVLGTLPAGGFIEVTVKFITKAPIDETCNFGYVKIPEMAEISDLACIGTLTPDTDI